MDVISELMGVPEADRDEVRRLADLLVHREAGVRDVPPAGMEAAIELFAYYGDMVKQRRMAPTDDLTSALVAGRARRRPAHRRRDHRVPLPDGRRGQRDDHEAARQCALPPVRAPGPAGRGLRPRRAATSWCRGSRRPCAYDNSTPDAGPLRDRRTSSCTVGPCRPGRSCCCSSASANRDERRVHRPRRSTTSIGPRTSSARALAFGTGRHFCLGRQPGPTRGPGRALRAGSPGRALRGARRPRGPGALGQRARLRPAAHDVRPARSARDGQVRTAHPSTGGRGRCLLGHRRRDRSGAGRRRPPGGARRPPGGSLRGARGGDPRRRGRGGRARARRDRRRVGRRLRRQGGRRPRRHRGRGQQRSLDRPGLAPRDQLRAAARRGRRQPARRRTGWSAPSCRRWSNGGAATSCSSPRTWPSGRGRSWVATARRSPGSKVWWPRCRWSSRAPGSGRRSSGRAPPGARWAWTGTPRRRPSSSTSGSSRATPVTRTSSRPARSRTPITTVVSAPRGVHLSPVDVNPEAPVEKP